jgi:hypothetical protein
MRGENNLNVGARERLGQKFVSLEPPGEIDASPI